MSLKRIAPRPERPTPALPAATIPTLLPAAPYVRPADLVQAERAEAEKINAFYAAQAKERNRVNSRRRYAKKHGLPIPPPWKAPKQAPQKFKLPDFEMTDPELYGGSANERVLYGTNVLFPSPQPPAREEVTQPRQLTDP